LVVIVYTETVALTATDALLDTDTPAAIERTFSSEMESTVTSPPVVVTCALGAIVA
jgi:hypothetical protein